MCRLVYTHVHAGTQTHLRARTRIHMDRFVILKVFPQQQGFVDVPQCCVICALPVLLMQWNLPIAEHQGTGVFWLQMGSVLYRYLKFGQVFCYSFFKKHHQLHLRLH